jgi:hypothetical protein
MQTYFNNHPTAIAFFFPVFFVALWCVIFFLISQASGWAVLARRFRLTSPFAVQTWDWKSARMRWGANYNNCLTIGSDPIGLYLSMVFPFALPTRRCCCLGKRFRFEGAGACCFSSMSS